MLGIDSNTSHYIYSGCAPGPVYWHFSVLVRPAQDTQEVQLTDLLPDLGGYTATDGMISASLLLYSLTRDTFQGVPLFTSCLASSFLLSPFSFPSRHRISLLLVSF